jgi:hypothetical protein
MGRTRLLSLIICTCIVLAACGTEQLRQVSLDDLRNAQVFLVDEMPDSFLLRIDRYRVLSIDGQPRLEDSEQVLLPKTEANREPELKIGDPLWVDGHILKPSAQAPSVTVPTSHADHPAFKGMELHSYMLENGSWAFSVLIGTNRNKFDNEIRSEHNRVDSIDALKERIASLARGELIFWINKADQEFPAELEQELIAYAQQQDVRLVRVDRPHR